MDISNYEFESMTLQGSIKKTETRIKIPRNSLSIGQTIYQVDFFYDDGIQELVVKGLEDYITVTDPKTGEEFSRPIKAGEIPEGYMIELGGDWTTHPYEKYLTKEDAYEASLLEHTDYIRDNQAMVDRWLLSIYDANRRMKNIKQNLRDLRE